MYLSACIWVLVPLSWIEKIGEGGTHLGVASRARRSRRPATRPRPYRPSSNRPCAPRSSARPRVHLHRLGENSVPRPSPAEDIPLERGSEILGGADEAEAERESHAGLLLREPARPLVHEALWRGADWDGSAHARVRVYGMAWGVERREAAGRRPRGWLSRRSDDRDARFGSEGAGHEGEMEGIFNAEEEVADVAVNVILAHRARERAPAHGKYLEVQVLDGETCL